MKACLIILYLLFASCQQSVFDPQGKAAPLTVSDSTIEFGDTTYVWKINEGWKIYVMWRDTVYIHDTIYKDDINIGSMQGDIITGTKNVKK